MPAAPAIVPLAAVNVPVPRPARLMPSLALLVESTSSKASVGAAGAGDVDGRAAGRADVRRAGGRHRDGAGVGEQEGGAWRRVVVVSARSPNVVVPVVLVRLTPPLPEPVTVMASKVLVPMLVPVASRATRAARAAVVIEIVPAAAKLTVPALLSRTPVAPLVR